MKALVLSGGGLKGAYQIGAYKALRKLNYNFDIVTGTSIGAINGAFITAKEYKKALELWKKVKINFLFQDKVNEDLIVLEYLRNIIENKGMNVEALQKNLNKYLNKNKFFKSNINFGLVTVNKTTKKPKYMEKKDLTKENLVDYLMASACFYPVFQSKKIDNNEYLDGGYHDNMPINFAIELGATEIIAIDLQAIGLRRKTTNKAKIKYIRPNNPLGAEMIVKNKQIRKNLKYGFNDTMKAFNELEGKKYTFKKGELEKYYNRYKEEYEKISTKKKKDYKFTKDELRRILENLSTILKIDDTEIYTIKKLNNIIKLKMKNKNIFQNELKNINKKSLTFPANEKIAIYISIICKNCRNLNT